MQCCWFVVIFGIIAVAVVLKRLLLDKMALENSELVLLKKDTCLVNCLKFIPTQNCGYRGGVVRIRPIPNFAPPFCKLPLMQAQGGGDRNVAPQPAIYPASAHVLTIIHVRPF